MGSTAIYDAASALGYELNTPSYAPQPPSLYAASAPSQARLRAAYHAPSTSKFTTASLIVTTGTRRPSMRPFARRAGSPCVSKRTTTKSVEARRAVRPPQGQTPGIKTPDRQRGQVEPCEREGAASAMPTSRHGCWVLCRPLLAAFEGPGSASGGAAPFFRHLRAKGGRHDRAIMVELPPSDRLNNFPTMAQQPLRTTTRVGASLAFNNLASNGTDLVYAHAHEAVFVPDGAVTALGMALVPTLLSDTSNTAVTQVRFIGAPLRIMAVLSQQQASFYSNDGRTLLHSFSLSKGMPPGSYLRGICACSVDGCSYIFVGTSGNGDLLRVDASTSSFGPQVELLGICSGAVSDLDAAEGGVLAAAAATCNVDGSSEVLLLSVGHDGTPAVTARFPTEAPGLCTSLRLHRGGLYCAYSTGRVQVRGPHYSIICSRVFRQQFRSFVFALIGISFIWGVRYGTGRVGG